MKFLLVLALLAVGTVAGAQSVPEPHKGLVARVQSADAAHRVSMHLTIDGKLHHTVGIDRSDSGSLRLTENGGTADGPIFVDLTESRGELTFTSDDPQQTLELRVTKEDRDDAQVLFARGTTIRLVRDKDGVLSVASSNRP